MEEEEVLFEVVKNIGSNMKLKYLNFDNLLNFFIDSVGIYWRSGMC